MPTASSAARLILRSTLPGGSGSMTTRNSSQWIFCDVLFFSFFRWHANELSQSITGSICNIVSRISNPQQSLNRQTVASLTNCGRSKIGTHACWCMPDLFRALGWFFGLHCPTMIWIDSASMKFGPIQECSPAVIPLAPGHLVFLLPLSPLPS